MYPVFRNSTAKISCTYIHTIESSDRSTRWPADIIFFNQRTIIIKTVDTVGIEIPDRVIQHLVVGNGITRSIGRTFLEFESAPPSLRNYAATRRPC